MSQDTSKILTQAHPFWVWVEDLLETSQSKPHSKKKYSPHVFSNLRRFLHLWEL